ncbi:tRNA (adenosine(37)-N6)-threonylcarbamoyltransferase complex dimerization subunit type 1 TsaB [Bacillus sp. B1-b2]|uniref:tRNA (adenosine(37)-N6)-threonylcarbamoyltransferase complex dimerization subunit type 1 TsaB n=1 Tax=Bacillus sp. B1-b2 TaxID=2653201 RepID=UPI001261B145|nr:tRNA (adenosine(37)-N6)-threonylcarbamoyltransferase complex dimerization subunit type 1 TsaB [Bacillus sp. B1-b2]KAB7665567.1 tRNA (adenosine(37)-N6)-threonylcarbamoyltransferase complex dimerization subunit type 1 TsaB [Bacillus sp. B1-b2]
MKILAIDTSNFVLGIAILDDGKVVGEYITNLKKNHSIRAMPAVEQLMNECNITPKELSKIIVAKGPGSYTGVRIGVTIAKTLAWTLKIPLVGVSSLEVLAASVGRYFNGYVSPLFDARRGQIYTGLYQFSPSHHEIVKEDQLIMNNDWVQQLEYLNQPILFVGNDLPIHEELLKDALGELAVFADAVDFNPRPSVLAKLGVDREGEDIHHFTPNYIRMVEAEANWLEANKNAKKEEK